MDDDTEDIPVYEVLPDDDIPRLANATLLMLARNSDLKMAANSVIELEKKFNQYFGYPWVFLNEVEFSDEFKQLVVPASIVMWVLS